MSISRLEYAGKSTGIHQAALQVNQRAVGQVIGVRESGLLDVSIGGRAYQAYSTIAAKPGDTLQLRLVSLQPQPVFTVVEPDDADATGNGVTYNHSGLLPRGTNSLPMNTGLAGLYQLLQQLPAQPPGRIAAEIQRLLQILEKVSIDSRDLQFSAQVKQQVLSSGMFLEAMMAAGYPLSMLVNDIKAQLYKTLRRLQPNRTMQLRNGVPVFAPLGTRPDQPVSGSSPPMGQVLQAYMEQQEPDEKTAVASKLLSPFLETTLCALVGRQMTVIEHHAQNQHIWLLDLLIRYAGETLTIPVTVGCHMLKDEEIWAVTFNMELPECGKLQIELHINQNTLDLALKTETAQTAQQILKARPALQRLLSTAGLTLDSMTTGSGVRNG